MIPTVPDEFIPHEPVYLGVTCRGCGEQVPPPGEPSEPIVYPDLEGGRRMLDVLALESGVWHLRCAFEASSVVETASPRRCLECGTDTRYRPIGADSDYRVCPTCPTTLQKATEGGGR